MTTDGAATATDLQTLRAQYTELMKAETEAQHAVARAAQQVEQARRYLARTQEQIATLEAAPWYRLHQMLLEFVRHGHANKHKDSTAAMDAIIEFAEPFAGLLDLRILKIELPAADKAVDEFGRKMQQRCADLNAIKDQEAELLRQIWNANDAEARS